MALKKPQLRKEVTEADAEALANKLADRPYGENKKPSLQPETLARTTISLPEGLLRELEDRALTNKRAGITPKNVSALVREALESYLKIN
ncbi:CopG family ribbon-helix-helix protein [Yersinia enterocolitica]|uniref:CopG family ribbon-helix-helix protein n=1 Tax=Yersinia enterocolitica TaxID=630 RepID=UPI00398CCBC4